MKMIVIEDVRARLEQHANPDDCWLYCDECCRFFQFRAVLDKQSPGGERCPFADCNGCGIGFNLFMWDDLRESDDPRWPTSTDELTHGLRAPEMAPFYEGQLAVRIHRITSAFARSVELAEYLDGQPPRYLPEFLQMASDLCWDLTDEEEGCHFFPDLARELLGDLPVWSQTADPAEAPKMRAELRAFFRFAERTRCAPNPSEWSEVLAADDIDEMFRFTMLHDRRLRPKANGT